MDKKEFYRSLSKLVVPIVLQNLISVGVNAMDVLMLGFVGQNELSAVSLAGQISFIYQLFISGITGGVVILSSQYWGRKNTEAIGKVYGIALRFSCLVSIVFWLTAILIPQYLMLIFTSDAELIRIGCGYLRIISFTYLFMSISQIYMASIRSVERVNICTLIGSTTLVLNIILNGILIFGWLGAPKLGIQGAAIATVSARAIELLWCMADSRRDIILKLRLRLMKAREPVMRKDFIRYTMPALTNYLVWGGGFSMYSSIMGHLGTDVVAANSVVSVIRNLAVVFGTGIGSGGSILLGKKMGSNRFDEVKAEAAMLCKLAFLAGVFGGLCMLAARPLILNWQGLTSLAKEYLNSMILINGIYCIGKVMNSTVIAGIFCAGGDTKFGLLCDAVDMWVFTIPLALLLAFVVKAPVMTVYLVLSLDEFVKMPFVFRHYRKYKWLNNLTRT